MVDQWTYRIDWINNWSNNVYNFLQYTCITIRNELYFMMVVFHLFIFIINYYLFLKGWGYNEHRMALKTLNYIYIVHMYLHHYHRMKFIN